MTTGKTGDKVEIPSSRNGEGAFTPVERGLLARKRYYKKRITRKKKKKKRKKRNCVDRDGNKTSQGLKK